MNPEPYSNCYEEPIGHVVKSMFLSACRNTSPDENSFQIKQSEKKVEKKNIDDINIDSEDDYKESQRNNNNKNEPIDLDGSLDIDDINFDKSIDESNFDMRTGFEINEENISFESQNTTQSSQKNKTPVSSQKEKKKNEEKSSQKSKEKSSQKTKETPKKKREEEKKSQSSQKSKEKNTPSQSTPKEETYETTYKMLESVYKEGKEFLNRNYDQKLFDIIKDFFKKISENSVKQNDINEFLEGIIEKKVLNELTQVQRELIEEIKKTKHKIKISEIILKNEIEISCCISGEIIQINERICKAELFSNKFVVFKKQFKDDFEIFVTFLNAHSIIESIKERKPLLKLFVFETICLKLNFLNSVNKIKNIKQKKKRQSLDEVDEFI